jgi:hypothetical protein
MVPATHQLAWFWFLTVFWSDIERKIDDAAGSDSDDSEIPDDDSAISPTEARPKGHARNLAFAEKAESDEINRVALQWYANHDEDDLLALAIDHDPIPDKWVNEAPIHQSWRWLIVVPKVRLRSLTQAPPPPREPIFMSSAVVE